MTQIEEARKGNITREISEISRREGVSPREIANGVAENTIVILANKRHSKVIPTGIGKGLTTKVNANIGTSTEMANPDEELKKLKVSIDAGAHTVMDLSTGGPLDEIRREILRNSPLPVGTVPIYQAGIETMSKGKPLSDMEKDKLFEVIEKHLSDGVDFITVHCGLTMEAIRHIKAEGRVTNIVSRGGAFLVEWMVSQEKENPLYEDYDRLLELAGKYDAVLSLGDGCRPGSLHDATDRGQVQELITLGELAERAAAAGVQVMIEGPGHIPLTEVKANVQLEKALCHGAPFYVLGPLVTDVAAGYDHITGAIGGAVAAAEGADFLCYVTPAEHLGLPTPEDVKEGVISSRIAAHAGDIAKGVKGALEWDLRLSKAREKRLWDEQIRLSIDPEKARLRAKDNVDDVCSMCGPYCAIKRVEKLFRSTP